MSKPRYPWWGYVKAMIREYPTLRERYADLHAQSMTADYSGMPRSGGAARGTEEIAIRELPSTKQREYEAVRRAIAQTERYCNGRQRLAVIRLVFWGGGKTLAGAAFQVPCGIATAKRWHGEFIKLVAENSGLLDGE